MKILPILIIPLFFLIVYLGVENLTQNNLQNDSNRVKINSLEPKKIEENPETISDKEKSLVKSKDSELKFEEKKLPPENNLIKDEPKKKEVKLNNKENKISEKKPISVKKTKNVEDSNQVLVQFGAFSRKDYAETSKNEIEKKIKKKFKQVNLDIDFVKDKKLYKLVYFAVNEKLAKSICDFSKDIKVSCLVKKK